MGLAFKERKYFGIPKREVRSDNIGWLGKKLDAKEFDEDYKQEMIKYGRM
jgi:hypothetical protein